MVCLYYTSYCLKVFKCCITCITDEEDSFEILEFAMVDEEWNNDTYFVNADLLDPVRLFNNYFCLHLLKLVYK